MDRRRAREQGAFDVERGSAVSEERFMLSTRVATGMSGLLVVTTILLVTQLTSGFAPALLS